MIGINAAQRILTQSSNISYLVRGIYRVETTVPEDRKADYLFRDFFGAILIAYLYEVAFRMVDKVYSFPLMTQVLGLDKLKALYPKTGPFKFKTVKDFPTITDMPVLRNRLTGSMVRSASNNLIPSLLEEVDLPKMSPAEQEAYQPVVTQMRRRLNYGEFIKNDLIKRGILSDSEAQLLKAAIDSSNLVDTALSKTMDKLTHAARKAKATQVSLDPKAFRTTLAEQLRAAVVERFELDGAALQAEKTVGSFLNKLAQNPALKPEQLNGIQRAAAVLDKLSKGQTKTLNLTLEKHSNPLVTVAKSLWAMAKGLVGAKDKTVATAATEFALDTVDGYTQHLKVQGQAHAVTDITKAKSKLVEWFRDALESRRAQDALKRIQKLNFWPKMLGTIIFNFIFAGVILSLIDVDVIQPWQKRLTAKGYKSGVTRWPSYLSVIPGSAVFAATMFNTPLSRLLKLEKMGYVGRYSLAGGLGLITYMAVAALMTKAGLVASKPKSVEKPVQTPKFIPEGFQEARLSHPGIFQAFQA
ncbi:MAG: hypothetical protein K2X01_11105 [Cyanobacteria bacterium]|nr:hypothetical protein [Cyanobacteriota bacterium]